jgi:hypothetical protein
MDQMPYPGLLNRVLSRAPVVASAALGALALVFAGQHPLLSLALLALSALAVLPPLVARARFRRILLSGDVERVVAIWRRSVRGATYADAVEPLMAAIAFAAYGWVDEARANLMRARLRPESQVAEEHCLFVEALVEAFDGDRADAMQKANALTLLPIPNVGARLQRRVLLLRASLAALTRAFAHAAQSGDQELLERAARSSPLVSWAMRYAAAVIAIDHHEPIRAQTLIANAPLWPEQSAFQAFHRELQQRLEPPPSATSASTP